MSVIFIVWVAFICLEQKTLKSHKKLWENKDFCVFVMTSKRHMRH